MSVISFRHEFFTSPPTFWNCFLAFPKLNSALWNDGTKGFENVKECILFLRHLQTVCAERRNLVQPSTSTTTRSARPRALLSLLVGRFGNEDKPWRRNGPVVTVNGSCRAAWLALNKSKKATATTLSCPKRHQVVTPLIHYQFNGPTNPNFAPKITYNNDHSVVHEFSQLILTTY